MLLFKTDIYTHYFAVSRPTPAFKEEEATPTKQIEQCLDEEDTSSKRKRQIPPSSRSVVKPVPQSQRVVAAPTTKTFKPQSEGLTPSVQVQVMVLAVQIG